MFVGYQRGIAVGRGYLGPRDVTRKGAAGQRDAFFRAAAAVPKTVALVARIEPVARMKRQRNPGVSFTGRKSFPDFTSFHPGYKMLTEQPAQNVLAARFAPEFCPRRRTAKARSPDERQRNPGRAFKLPTRSRISRSLSSGRPLRAGPVGSSGLQSSLQRREAERRQTRISNLRTRNLHPPRLRGRTEEGARRASGGTRSPVGVPPRLLLRRTNATAQLRLRASWDAALTGVTRLEPVPVQRAPRRPVIVPAGRIPEAARERSSNPPAGTAPAPSSGLPPEGVPSERDSSAVAEIVTNVNGGAFRHYYGDNGTARVAPIERQRYPWPVF